MTISYRDVLTIGRFEGVWRDKGRCLEIWKRNRWNRLVALLINCLCCSYVNTLAASVEVSRCTELNETSVLMRKKVHRLLMRSGLDGVSPLL